MALLIYYCQSPRNQACGNTLSLRRLQINSNFLAIDLCGFLGMELFVVIRRMCLHYFCDPRDEWPILSGSPTHSRGERPLFMHGEMTPLSLCLPDKSSAIRCRLVQAMRFDLSPRLRAVPGVIMYHCEPIASPGLAGTCAFPGLERLLMPGVAADQSVLANISDTDEFQASNLALRLIIEMLLLIWNEEGLYKSSRLAFRRTYLSCLVILKWVENRQVWVGYMDVWVGYRDVWVGYREVRVGYRDVWVGYREVWVGYRDVWVGYREVRVGYRDVWVGYREVWVGYREVWVGYREVWVGVQGCVSGVHGSASGVQGCVSGSTGKCEWGIGKCEWGTGKCEWGILAGKGMFHLGMGIWNRPPTLPTPSPPTPLPTPLK